MPSSFLDSVGPIMHTVIDIAPRRVLDVGPGYGKYGLMCREYLPELVALDAVEVPEGRLSEQAAIYDHVLEIDVREITGDALWSRYELVLLIDVIEHMPKEDGHELLSGILTAGPMVLVSTPKEFFEQHDEDNPFEEHVSHWLWTDFDPYRIRADASTIDSIIYLLKGVRQH